MDPELHKAVTQRNLELLQRRLTDAPKSLHTKTPQHKTALHIAARLGYRHVSEIILRECETLMLEKDIDGDTPLHIASKFGKKEVVDLLINYAVGRPDGIKSEEGGPLTVKNKLEVALRLLEANHDVADKLNGRKESPLHIAAREGMTMVVKEILKQSSIEKEEQTRDTGSPLHQAALGGHIKIVEMLLDQRNDLVKHVDSDGNNALHYAAHKDNAKIVEILIKKASSLAYKKNNSDQTPLYVAVQYGSKSAIKEILKSCPDTAEEVGSDGGTVFHIAVNKGKYGSLKCLLKHIELEDIINHKDHNGNTPLHLAAKQSRIQSAHLLLKDRRVNPCLLNNDGQTARSVIETLEADAYEMFIWRELKKQEAKRCKKQDLPPAVSSRSLGRKKMTSHKYFELSVQTYTVVAALIATVTFSAIFTMPGGYDKIKGLPILGKKPAFKPFVISNTIAMCSSLVVVFSFLWAWRDPVKFKLNQLKWGHRLTVVACLSMITSLMTAVDLTVGPESKWVSIVVMLIGCGTPFMVCLVLGHEVVHVPL